MKEREYSPTTYFFDSKKWSESFDIKERSTSSLFNDGLIIGELLREIDNKCARLVKITNGFSEHEILAYQQVITLKLFLDIKNGRDTNDLDSLFEVIHESSQLCIALSKQTFIGYKSKDTYHELYDLASQRIYLENQWEKIAKSSWTFRRNGDGIVLTPSEYDIDFGEKVAVQRFKDHLRQLLHGASRDGGVIDPKIKSMPSDIIIKSDGVSVIYNEPDEDVSIQHQLILNQYPFYYREYKNVPLKDYKHLNLFDVRYLWIVFTRLSTCIIKNSLTGEGFNQPIIFSKKNLVDILTNCINMSISQAEQLIELHTNSRRKLSDFYLKPIYEIDGDYYISLGVFMGGQITRVIDEIVKTQLNKKNMSKGKFFEKNFKSMISDQMSKNKILQSGFCHVLALGFKQSKGKENEEIDLIIRIGETYLLIEAKSFIYRTGVMGYHNNLKELKDSNAKQKIDFFISEYDRFKKNHDKDAIFDLKPENVVFCYLSSVPHAAGIKINNMPVVDSSILERYFGQGNFEMMNEKKESKFFNFYTTFEEAEGNLKRYLDTPPTIRTSSEQF